MKIDSSQYSKIIGFIDMFRNGKEMVFRIKDTTQMQNNTGTKLDGRTSRTDGRTSIHDSSTSHAQGLNETSCRKSNENLTWMLTRRIYRGKLPTR